jgi:4a-hydroxytetrahydrobiopterin dehydratase
MTETALWQQSPRELPKGTPPLTDEDADALLAQVDPAWQREGTTLRRAYEFKTFSAAFAWATRVALLAERYNHHPDIEVGWGYVRVTFSTHSIGGLSENDFILAARLDRLT